MRQTWKRSAAALAALWAVAGLVGVARAQDAAAGAGTGTGTGTVTGTGTGAGAGAATAAAAGTGAAAAAALNAKYDSLRPQLQSSPFGRPLLLQSNSSTSRPQGDVYAVVPHPFQHLSAALQRGDQWCDLLILQSNVKRCVPQGDPAQTLKVAIGRKFDQPIQDAYQVEFRYALRDSRPDHLRVQMDSSEGPLGTRDYKIQFEAVPVDARHSFVHMSYAYSAGVAARMATDAYLATVGRDKVGFSVVGRDDAGKPQYVDGVRGIAERNTMRYYLAIEAVLNAMTVPAERQVEARLRDWFAATERYPRQLKEMDVDDYMAMKRREVRAQGTAAKPVS